MQAICLDCKQHKKIVEIERYANGLYALRCDDCLNLAILKEEKNLWDSLTIKVSKD